jgi:hypothetical protein
MLSAEYGRSTRERNWRLRGRIFAAAGLLVLAGCGGGEGEPQTSAGTARTSASGEVLPGASATAAEGPMLVFDDLGGGSSIIQVYPGVTNTAAHKRANGTFNDGDAVPAECWVKGREVESDPSVGEAARTSEDWVRITGTPGEVQYATTTYAKDPEALLPQLDECPK